MKLNENKFYDLAKENNFETADLTTTKASSISLSVFHGELNSFTTNETYKLVARGILNGKLGSVSTETVDKSTPEYLINSIKRTALSIENDDPVLMFKGSKKYHKKNVFNKNVITSNIREKVNVLLEIERKLLNYDKRINEVVTVSYEESCTDYKISNSYGLKLSQKTAIYTYFAEISAKDGDEIRSGYRIFTSDNPDEFNVDKFVKKVADETLSKLGSIQCKSGKYPVVFNQETASTLLSYLLLSLDAEEIQKHTSLFEGKLNQKVLSSKLSITENPLIKGIHFRYFDDEGVATYKKDLIKRGVITNFLYTLQTAKKAGVDPTGNGYRVGSKARADISLSIVKPGKISEEEMISTIKEGVYITELAGLHSGMNEKSGNYSLQCAGFMIRDGKKAEPLSLITVADNLLNTFNNIQKIANNAELINDNSMICPSILVRKISISGK